MKNGSQVAHARRHLDTIAISFQYLQRTGVSPRRLQRNGRRTNRPTDAELWAYPAWCELSESTPFAEACAFEHAYTWREAMAKEVNGLEATGPFGTGY